MLYINQKNITAATNFNDIMIAVEKALLHYKNDDYNMPERFHYTHENKTLLYMPCFSNNTLGTKILTVFPENASKNYPAIDGLMMLNDYETGRVKALIDGKLLTALRTAAVGNMGTKYLTKDSVNTLGLIGAGTQGFYQILFACSLRNFKDVYIHTRTMSKLDNFIKRLQNELPNINFHKCESAEDVVKMSDVIITATSSFESVLPENEELYKGKKFIAIGSYKPDMRELPNALMKVADEVYVDIMYAKEESGDLHIPLQTGVISEDKIFSMADLIYSQKNISDFNKTIVYKSVGMALFDVIVGEKILECAEVKGIGTRLD